MNKRAKILSIFYLGRFFESSLIGATGVIELIMLGVTDLEKLAILGLGAIFMMVGIYSMNDVLDLEEDKINHPERPIPNGELTAAEASVLGGFAFVIATAFFWMLGNEYVLLFFLGSSVGVLYSRTTKHVTYGKTTTVLATAIIGALTVAWVEIEELNETILAFTFSIGLLLLGYEIMKDMRDVTGDSQVGIRTIPMILGFKKATILAGIAFVLSCFSIGIFFLTRQLVFEGTISVMTGVLIIPAFAWLYFRSEMRVIDLVRMFAIGTIGFSLNIVAISIYFRQVPSS